MVAPDLLDTVRIEAETDDAPEERARRIAELIRTHTGYRWVGIYRVTDRDVRNLAWSGPDAPAYPNFPLARGLTGAAIESRSTVISNDVATDPRYLTNQQSTGSELIAPVVVAGKVVGTLDVEDASKNAFDDEVQALFEELAQALTHLYT